MMGHFSPKQLQKNDALCILADVFWFKKEKQSCYTQEEEEENGWENQELRETKRQNGRSTLLSK